MREQQEIIIMKNSNFSIKDPRNLSILTDFYELSMANGFFRSGRKDDIGVFDLLLGNDSV